MRQRPRKRKSKNYLIMGTSHQGLDSNVLKILSKFAKHFDAQPVHLGSLSTKDEIAMWRRRRDKLVTWENASEQKKEKLRFDRTEQVSILDEKIRNYEEELESENITDSRYDKVSEIISNLNKKSEQITEKENLHSKRLGLDLERFHSEITELENIQSGRVSVIQKFFGRTKFVCNDKLCIPTAKAGLGGDYIHRKMEIGKYLSLTAVPANGDKISGQPITPRTFRMLKKMGGSHVVPHMAFNTRPFSRPGLNQAFNYFTTGSLQFCDDPEMPTDAYKSMAKPGAIFVTVDEESGEFHPVRIKVKRYLNDSKNWVYFIVFDGLVFTNGKVKELSSKDKATFVTDDHCPYEHMGVLASARKLNSLHEPGTFVGGGDMSDCGSVSRHAKGKPGQTEGLRLSDDLNGMRRYANALTDPKLFPFIKERILLDSNHHEWLTNLCDEIPALKGILDWNTVSKIYLPLWNVFIRVGGSDKFFKFGDCIFKHADGEGTVAVASDIYGNYIGGHHHKFWEWGDAVFTGPACKLGPKYLNNRATSWQNQITSISKYRGFTCKHQKIVLHNEKTEQSKFMYRGEVYEVPYHVYDEAI